jgi:DNA (cytosine-5)-methyltransferase 1
MQKVPKEHGFRMIDLFAGIGGTRLGFTPTGGRCVFTAEWDKFARLTYSANFSDGEDHLFAHDITKVEAGNIPDHDLLLAGFPCQPFSIAGVSKKNSLGRSHGFEDSTQGTLFFDIARILAEKRPPVFLLENVKNLLSHDKGKTFKTIMDILENELRYQVRFKVVDSRSWVPQKRKRILIVGFNKDHFEETVNFDFPEAHSFSVGPTLSAILHPENGSEDTERDYTTGPLAKVNPKYTLTPGLWRYLRNYAEKHRKAGNGFGYGLVGPEDIARTLSARYYKDGSEILIDRGKWKRPRRLTPRECARLMGFPDSFVLPVSDTQAYKQFGNSIVVPMVHEVAIRLAPMIYAAKERSVSES